MTAFPEENARNAKADFYSPKWVLKNKGEKVGERRVVREIKKAKSEDDKLQPSDVFSAMPPVVSLNALISHVMAERVDRRGQNWVLAVFDVSRAHFYGVCERDPYVEPPSELHRPGLVAKLNKMMYGTQAMRGRNCGASTSAAMALSSVQAIQRCTDQSL